ncbi:hypothetical protein IW261DRAFT_1419775 [Armillaria novae-zelandiae]|uniref:Uncharacterized protein n=1 Tax=Armillaria novae-zelandiae TaxID=153914 RepID=A0AA39UI20_9AGAR|nr:hypothetical protein IW261DRAFT_1419775 [Armillaria novae-zelandiae]
MQTNVRLERDDHITRKTYAYSVWHNVGKTSALTLQRLSVRRRPQQASRVPFNASVSLLANLYDSCAASLGYWAESTNSCPFANTSIPRYLVYTSVFDYVESQDGFYFEWWGNALVAAANQIRLFDETGYEYTHCSNDGAFMYEFVE